MKKVISETNRTLMCNTYEELDRTPTHRLIQRTPEIRHDHGIGDYRRASELFHKQTKLPKRSHTQFSSETSTPRTPQGKEIPALSSPPDIHTKCGKVDDGDEHHCSSHSRSEVSPTDRKRPRLLELAEPVSPSIQLSRRQAGAGCLGNATYDKSQLEEDTDTISSLNLYFYS